jgi:hypothetical protein
MNKSIALILAASIPLTLAACGKKKEEDKGGTAAKPAAGDKATAAEPAKLEWKKLENMKLQIEAPSDAKVEENKQDDWSATLMDDKGNFYLNVSTVTPAYAETFEKDFAEVEKDPGCTFASWTKKETTPDGWHLESKCKGMSGDEKIAINIRKKIGDKSYSCWQKTEKADQAAAYVKACQSLKAL